MTDDDRFLKQERQLRKKECIYLLPIKVYRREGQSRARGQGLY